MKRTICYVGGCGRLGFPMAAWTAYRGFTTYIADINEEAVQAVREGKFHSPEPRADVVARRASMKLTATTNTGAAAEASDIIFILVQTPSLVNGSFSIYHVLNACDQIGLALKGTDKYKVVAVASTVMPGHVNGPIRERLETVSGKAAHRDFGLCYCPEFIRQGSIVRDFSNPEYVVIGREKERAADIMADYYRAVTENKPQIHHISIASAEIAKLGLNTAIVAKLARANELAWLCHETSGADAAEVLRVIGVDSRIGGKYFAAGPPPGGPCFPRDNLAMAMALQSKKISPHVTSAVLDFDRYHIERLAQLTQQQYLPGRQTVGILGLTYKPDVDLLVGSMGLMLASKLRPPIVVFDPAVKSPYTSTLNADSVGNLARWCDVIVLMTCWPEFKDVERIDLTGKIVIDLWGFLDESRLNCERYVRFGRGDG